MGVVDTIEALRRSHEAGLDLVEVAPDVSPPVCRILDFGKYKYELAKKEKANKAKSKMAEMKEVRLGRSMKIDPHDVAIRIDQAHRFLMEGHKVQIVQNFRGRELMHRHLGDQRMRDIIQKLADISKVETPPRLAGRRMSVILAPDKPKIDALNRKKAAAAKQQQTRPEGAAATKTDGMLTAQVAKSSAEHATPVEDPAKAAPQKAPKAIPQSTKKKAPRASAKAAVEEPVEVPR